MKFIIPIAVFYSPDGGEYWVSPPYAGRFRVFGPWTCDAIYSAPKAADAIKWAKKWAEAS